MKHNTVNLNDRENMKGRRVLKPVQNIHDICALFYLFLDGFLGEMGKYYYLFTVAMLVFSIAVIIYNHKYEKRKNVRLHSIGVSAAVCLMFLLNLSFVIYE